jgi:hypothetical protein
VAGPSGVRREAAYLANHQTATNEAIIAVEIRMTPIFNHSQMDKVHFQSAVTTTAALHYPSEI